MFGIADASSPNHGWRFGMENGRFYSTMKGASAGLDASESQAILADVMKLSMAVQGDSETLGK